jgi:hypothetical protein
VRQTCSLQVSLGVHSPGRHYVADAGMAMSGTMSGTNDVGNKIVLEDPTGRAPPYGGHDLKSILIGALSQFACHRQRKRSCTDIPTGWLFVFDVSRVAIVDSKF